MAKIRINPDIIDNYGNNIKGQAGYVIQLAEAVNQAAISAPSYNGQFGPKVRAIGASAHSAGRQHSERLSNQGQKLNSVSVVFRSVDTLQLYAAGAYRNLFSPEVESWFERKIRELRILLTQRIQKNEEKLRKLKEEEAWYSNEIASVLDKIAKKNKLLAYILRGLIKRGDLDKLRNFIQRNRNISVFFLGLPSYWQLNYLLRVVEVRDRKRKEIAKTEKELISDRRLLDKIGGPLLPEKEEKPKPGDSFPLPAVPEVPAPPVPAPQPVPTPDPVPEPKPANPNGTDGECFGSKVSSVDPVNPYGRICSDGKHYSNCTWYAWQAVYEWSGKKVQIPVEQGEGGAEIWPDKARKALENGESWIKSINSTPEPGSVIFIKPQHVAFVESVQYDGNGNIVSMKMSDEQYYQNNFYKGWDGWREIKASDPLVKRYTYTIKYNQWIKDRFKEGSYCSINFNYPA